MEAENDLGQMGGGSKRLCYVRKKNSLCWMVSSQKRLILDGWKTKTAYVRLLEVDNDLGQMDGNEHRHQERWLEENGLSQMVGSRKRLMLNFLKGGNGLGWIVKRDRKCI